LKTVVQIEREEKAENLQYLWMGANLQYEGLKEVLGKMNVPQPVKKKPKEDTKKVNKDWRRLASAMRGWT